MENKATIRGIFTNEIHKAIEEWDTEKTFDELWHDSECGPFEFADMIREDTDYFENVDDKISKEAI